MSDNDRFIVRHKSLIDREEATTTTTLRINKGLMQRYDDLAKNSNRSRNELMNLALKYAIDHLEFMDK
jgi:predicted transcriptional regulator